MNSPSFIQLFHGHAFNSKSHKKIRKTFFRGVELIRVEVMKSRETWRHNDIQKEIQSGVEMVDYN